MVGREEQPNIDEPEEPFFERCDRIDALIEEVEHNPPTKEDMMVNFRKWMKKRKKDRQAPSQPKEVAMPDEPFVPFSEQQKSETDPSQYPTEPPSESPVDPPADRDTQGTTGQDPQPTPDAWGSPNEDYQVFTARVLRETDTASRLLFTYAEHEQRLWIDHADIFEPAAVIGKLGLDVKCAVKIATLKAKGVIPVEE